MRKTLTQRVAELEADRDAQALRIARIFQTMREACEAAGIQMAVDEDEARTARPQLHLVP